MLMQILNTAWIVMPSAMQGTAARSVTARDPGIPPTIAAPITAVSTAYIGSCMFHSAVYLERIYSGYQ